DEIVLEKTRSESILSPVIVGPTSELTSNFTGVACCTSELLSVVVDAGLLFQVMPVSVQESMETNPAVAGALPAATLVGIRRTLAPAGAEATLVRSNLRYDSRLLSLVPLLSF